MDPTLLASLGMMNPAGSGNGSGGILGMIAKRMQGSAAPAVPGDGSMQPTIGPGAAPAPTAPAAAYTPKLGLPQGGLLAMLQGQAKPQGLMGLLQNKFPGFGGSPLAGGMPGAGMIGAPGQFPVPAPDGSATPAPGLPGSAYEGPAAPQLPMDITPSNQF